MGLAAPIDSDPVSAEAGSGREHKFSQAAEPSQTASEYVELPDIPLVGLLSNIRVLSYIDTQLQLEAEAREVLPYVCARLSFEQGCC
jgi:hypothetical protein